jgi:ABC-type dipeptide/oligopeptide/nickel transport system permease component
LLNFTLRRILFALPSLFGVITLSFFLIHLVPGDPVDFVLGEQADARDKENLRHELGLDLPLGRQYTAYLANLTHLDLGRSVHTRGPVFHELASRFPATFELSLAALGFALLWGLPLGVWSAVKPQSLRDHGFGVIGLIGMSVPGVFLGPALVYIFAMRLDLLPVSERGGLDHLILPALSLALPLGAVILRMTRASMLEVVNEDYIRTARAKGASERRIFFHHAFRNALTPVITIVGIQLGAILTGTVVTETIFDWPGLGTLLFGSIQRRDYPMVQGCVLFVACIYVLINLLTDLSYGIVNPKIRLEK